MNIEHELLKRSGRKCELCGGIENLKVFKVLPIKKDDLSDTITQCLSYHVQLLLK